MDVCRLREIREERELSQPALSRLCHTEGVAISTQSIAAWEKGLYKPSGSKLLGLCRVLGVKVDDLFHTVPEPTDAGKEER